MPPTRIVVLHKTVRTLSNMGYPVCIACELLIIHFDRTWRKKILLTRGKNMDKPRMNRFLGELRFMYCNADRPLRLTEGANHPKHHAEYPADYRLGNDDEDRAELADYALQNHQ